MNTLVTGGAGFIGSHLTERLLDEGHLVTVIDNFAAGRPENLASRRGDPALKIIRADVTDEQALRPHFAGAEWVFHLAAIADIVPSIERPMDYARSNIMGTLAVLEAARRAGAKRFVYAASSSGYGIPDQFPTPEDAAIRPLYPYALTKALGEQAVFHWNRVYKMPCISLRLFNVYGPRSRTTGAYGAVFGVFLAQKLAGKPFTLVGDGQQTRDFTYVTDVAEAFVGAAASDAQGEAFNVGSGRACSINYLVKLLGGSAVHIPKRPGEPDCTHADIARISKKLGWHPKISFEEGVLRMLESIGDWRDAPVWDERTIAAATKGWFAYLSSA